MPDNLLETLRAKTAHSESEKTIENVRIRDILLVAEAERQRNLRNSVANYVASILHSEIRRFDEKAVKSAEDGESSTRKTWIVNDKNIQNRIGHHAPIITGEIDPKTVEEETAKVLAVRSAMTEHYEKLGVSVLVDDGPVGFDEEVIDYGWVFNRTGTVYGFSISWAAEPEIN